MRIKPYLILLLFVVLIAAGCSQPEPEAPNPEELVALAAERMSTMPGFRFSIESKGSEAYLDKDETFYLGQAVGFYTAPDKAQTEVSVLTPGFATNVSVISIGENQWQTNPITGGWTETPPEWGFNPADLFDAETGVQSILLSDLTGLRLVGVEQLVDGPEKDLYAVSGTLDGSGIAKLSRGILDFGQMDAKLWISPDTYELYRVIIAEPTGEGEELGMVWQIDFSQFGLALDITPPENSDA